MRVVTYGNFIPIRYVVQVGKDITWQDSLILENEVSVLNNVLYGDLTGVFLVVGCTLFISLVNCLSEIIIYVRLVTLLMIISFTLYPAYISSVVIVGFLFNKSSLNLYFLVVQGLVLYLSLGWGIDVLVHRITLTLPLVHWFQLRLLLVNWEYLVDSLSGIMLVIIALISLNVNVYSVDLLVWNVVAYRIYLTIR